MMTRSTTISTWAIAHQVSLRVGLGFGLTLCILTRGPLLSYVLASFLVYLLVWSAALTAPYLFGSEMSAAAAQAMNQITRRIRLLRPACYDLLRRSRQLAQPPTRPGWSRPLRCLSRPVLLAKSSLPFLLFPFAPLAIP